ncbi:RNA polymerase alpha subunit C-terminal domain-containing protein [Cytobacillus oceanisediminis]|uniref:RNA polymerase alpha subunit C-terminal domain-containing protein n=1 Tax=Cytobacillus oceanisediminis TaxID=665099 RepID=UPI003B586EAA
MILDQKLFGGIILTADKSLRVCEKGHKFYKSSECKSCPICDKENKPKGGFLSKLSAPARNALVHEGIDTLKKLSKFTEKEILKIHGIGPASLPIMRTSLKEEGLSFKE